MQERFNFRHSMVISLIAMSSMLSATLLAQDTKPWRGGWQADVAGLRHVLYLVLRDGKVSGTYCADCHDQDQLAFVDDGTLDANGLHFSLYHADSKRAPYVEKVEARLDKGELHLTLQQAGAAAVHITMKRSAPRTPAAGVPQPNPPTGVATRPLPAAATTVTADIVVGLWLSGAGPGKQYFMFKRHKSGVRGMVCGPCEDPKDFAPLENISMNGTTLHFDIVHEDNGGGYEEHGPFVNVTEAQLAMNELRLSTVPSFDPDSRKFEMTLLGPVRYQPRGQP